MEKLIVVLLAVDCEKESAALIFEVSSLSILTILYSKENEFK